MSKTDFEERVAEALEKVTDKTTFQKIVVAGRFICNVCGKSFSEYRALKNKHWPIHNGTIKKYTCNICGKTSLRNRELQRHEVRVHGTEEEKNEWRTKCNMCEKFVYKFDLSTHISIYHQKNPRNTYKCEKCGAEYKTKQSYSHHILTHSEGPQQCDVCAKFLPSSISLERHKKQVHGQQIFSCDKCPKQFVSLKKLKGHKMCHEDVRKYVCDECGKNFKYRQHFNQHRKCHQDIQEKGEGAFTCDLCNDGKVYKHSIGLYEHKRRYHSGRIPSNKSDKDKIHQCSICGNRLCSAKDLKKHEKRHKEKPGFKPRVRKNYPGYMLPIANENQTSEIPSTSIPSISTINLDPV